MAEHPYRERLWGQWMLALYRADRQADAFRQRSSGSVACWATSSASNPPAGALQPREGDTPPQSPRTRLVLDAIQRSAWPEHDGRRSRLARRRSAARPADEGGRQHPVRRTRPGAGGDAPGARGSRARSDVAESSSCAVSRASERRLSRERSPELPTNVAAPSASGRCDEDLGLPYQPWATAVAHLVDHCPPGALDQVVTSRRARTWPDSVPRSRTWPPTAPHRVTRRSVAPSTLRGRTGPRRSGSPRRLVVVLDDLHWGDVPSLQLLRYLVGSGGPGRSGGRGDVPNLRRARLAVRSMTSWPGCTWKRG